MVSIHAWQCTGCKAMHQADKLKMGETILFLPLFIDVIISGVLYLEVCFLFT